MALANTYRFFVSPDAIAGDAVRVADADLAHQIGKVLRLRPGEQVLLLDGGGSVYTVTLTGVARDAIAGRIERRDEAGGELPVYLALYVAVLRAERFEWVLQKGTELGVSRFVPVRFARSLAGDRAPAADGAGAGRKLDRWQRIVREAAEQACRARLPQLAAPLDLTAACAAAGQAGLRLLLWEGPAPHLRGILRDWRAEDSSPIHPSPASPGSHRSIAVLSGPEGGITPAELAAAAEHGIIPVSLGPRILRAETAPITAAAAIGYELAS